MSHPIMLIHLLCQSMAFTPSLSMSEQKEEMHRTLILAFSVTGNRQNRYIIMVTQLSNHNEVFPVSFSH